MLFGDDNLGIKINIISRLLGARFDKKVKKIFPDLANTQFAVMSYLFDHKDEVVTQNQLAAAMRCSHPTIRNVIKRMITKKLVQIAPSSSDKRKVEVYLTDYGMSLFAEKEDDVENMLSGNQDFLTKGLSDAEVQSLNRMLGIVVNNLKGESDRGKH
ncbi:MarR family winged helix-turn-helix transcriptional regulator [Apilactobacillus bombintestini]|uniref:MarR family transcriptional regulator n=1 Tax=Apilactobacillus bombintestini TaxID=2419772 RepID=A0A387AS23_9LACO|nr:MarR family transcriptional regulator [Apilactobacillus bombintestini]AYF92015.1 MarR family transcriptional regulator [Apilactobacillus bombintestini]